MTMIKANGNTLTLISYESQYIRKVWTLLDLNLIESDSEEILNKINWN